MAYKKETHQDMNDLLINYVDLKYTEIWSDEFLKKKKCDLKEQNFYFRAVKQGSQVIYLSFHVFTILIILFMATMRQSFIGLVYVFILLPRIKDGSEVLQQSTLSQNKKAESLQT
jgi:uncharacterized membrane protein